MTDKVAIQVMRSQLGRVRGTGSAHSGVHHWYAERITAIALVPLSLWFVFSMLRLVGARQEEVAQWAGHPVNTVLLLALIAMTFHHMQLGVQVVLEDYVNAKWLMNVLMLLTKAAAGLLGLTAAVAVLKLTLA
ncbi:MAG: succinate dehydrogenase, hydrophobic membrane anchor protein [Acetobacteraceae bacterium]|nr:succinate dehydrogenase, hydrophobic membrane anchor protein [Acetobacteraceae bacterium]